MSVHGLTSAQRSMIRTKHSIYIGTHAPYLERERARSHTHTHHIFYRKHAHAIYFTGEETIHKHSYAHIHTAIINRRYSMQSACASPSSITAAFPLRRKHVQMSGHGLTSCAAIDDSSKVEYVHRQYSLQGTLHRNCNLCNER